MTDKEKKADKLLKLAYKNNGYILVKDVLQEFDNDISYIDESVLTLIEPYGAFGSNELDSLYGWNYYRLSHDGYIFAKNGGYKGKESKARWIKVSVAASIVAALSTIVGLLFSNLFLLQNLPIDTIIFGKNPMFNVVVDNSNIYRECIPYPIAIVRNKALSSHFSCFQSNFFVCHNYNLKTP